MFFCVKEKSLVVIHYLFLFFPQLITHWTWLSSPLHLISSHHWVQQLLKICSRNTVLFPVFFPVHICVRKAQMTLWSFLLLTFSYSVLPLSNVDRLSISIYCEIASSLNIPYLWWADDKSFEAVISGRGCSRWKSYSIWNGIWKWIYS